MSHAFRKELLVIHAFSGAIRFFRGSGLIQKQTNANLLYSLTISEDFEGIQAFRCAFERYQSDTGLLLLGMMNDDEFTLCSQPNIHPRLFETTLLTNEMAFTFDVENTDVMLIPEINSIDKFAEDVNPGEPVFSIRHSRTCVFELHP